MDCELFNTTTTTQYNKILHREQGHCSLLLVILCHQSEQNIFRMVNNAFANFYDHK